MENQRKPPPPPAGALVQKTQCETCIYRPETVYDTDELENLIRDPRDPTHFSTPRACHAVTGRTVVCRGFWDRHAEDFDLGQLAVRLDAVYTIDETNAVVHEPQGAPRTPPTRRAPGKEISDEMTSDITAERRAATAMKLACERLEDSVDRPANNHQIIVGGDDAMRTAFRKELLKHLRDSPRLADHYEAVFVGRPPGGADDARLAEMWAATLAGLPEIGSDDLNELVSWTNAGGPADRDATDKLETAVLRIIEKRRRKTAVIVDDLETWNRSWRKHDEDWSLRKILQTEPKLALVGISATWTADGDPDYALYCGLSQSNLS